MGQPLLALLRDAQMLYGVLDIAGDDLPVKGGIALPQICWRGVAQAHGHTRFGKLCKQRREFAQVMWVSQLANQIRRAHQPRIIGRVLVIGIARDGKARAFNIGDNTFRIEQGVPTKALADKLLPSVYVIRGQRGIRTARGRTTRCPRTPEV